MSEDTDQPSATLVDWIESAATWRGRPNGERWSSSAGWAGTRNTWPGAG